MKNIQQAIDLIEQSVGGFNKQLTSVERKLLDELLNLTKQLEVKNGNIITNTANLKLINKVKNKLNRIIVNKQYIKEVGNITKAFDKIKSYQDDYFTQFGKPAQKGVLNELDKMAVNNMIDGLAGSGVSQNISEKIISNLRAAVTSGDSYNNLVTQLSNNLQTTSTSDGDLTKYAKTYARDAINDYMGERNKIIADDLGLEWFMYVGSNISTTREFCKYLTKKKYVHISEIPTILKGKIGGHQCKLNIKSGLPNGMIDGTNPSNFIIRRGGWNCGHQLVPVAEEAVPIEIRNKFKNSL